MGYETDLAARELLPIATQRHIKENISDLSVHLETRIPGNLDSVLNFRSPFCLVQHPASLSPPLKALETHPHLC